MTRLTRLMAAAALLSACALLAPGPPAIAAKTKPYGAKTKRDSGIAYLGITRISSSAVEYAAGNDYDRVLGTGASAFVIKARIDSTGIHVIAEPMVLYSAAGSLSGTATGKATVTASGETLRGNFSLTRGRGAQRGHSFTGTFTAVSDKTFRFFTFNYKGTYR